MLGNSYFPGVQLELSLLSYTPDPQIFLASAAQISSSLVGFIGGFFVVRLEGYINEWRSLKTQIDILTTRVLMAESALERVPATTARDSHYGSDGPELSSDEVEELKERLNDSLRSLQPLLRTRAAASFPSELMVVGVLLLFLFVVGVLVPMFALPQPSAAMQALYLSGLGAVVLAIAGVMAFNTRRAWRQLHSSGRSGLERG